jgi:Domain of unknown function (DUF222)/HNH endonuclease
MGMAISSDTGPGPVEVLGHVGGAVASLAEVLWAARADGELVEVVAAVAGLRAVLAGVEAGAVAEIQARGAAKRLGWASTADWLTHVGGLRRGAGRRVVRRAQALTTDRAETRAALAAGELSSEQADVVLEAVEALPTAPLLRRTGEVHLLEQARHLDATDLARAGRHLAHVVDPDRQERRLEAALDRDERAAHLGRFLAITDDGAGGVRIKGRGSVEDAAVLRAALLPLTRPRPTSHDPEHQQPGSPAQDPRDHGARLWDALVTTAQHALDTNLPPTSHGLPPRVAVTIDLDDLRAGLGAADTEDGLRLSAAAVRRLACDAGLIPVVLGAHGAVLDVGRERRLVTPSIWQALVARDQHCAFPSCTRPPVMCHAHHIHHWTHGGPTRLDNLVLLCGHHHRLIHHTPWEVQLANDGRPEFLPPPHHHPPSHPIRHRPRRE